MRKQTFIALVAVLLSMSATCVWGQSVTKPAKLKGIWQMCFYVSEKPDAPSTLRAGNTFKILSDDGKITNFTVVPGKGAIVTGQGTYKQISDKIFRETMVKNIHLPMLDGQNNDLEFSMSEDNNVMSVKFFIEKDEQGNVIDAWYYETWRRVEMPAEYPQDLIR